MALLKQDGKLTAKTLALTIGLTDSWKESLSHKKWKCQYHILFIPQYRKKQLYGKVKDDV